jgi:hypothetical protein
MQARTLTIITVLLDLKKAFTIQLREKRKNPALLLIYAFIDICAALVNNGKTENRDIFRACIDEYVMMSGKPFDSYDLWSARSSLLHSYSPLGFHTKKTNGAKKIFYYSWPERKEELESILREKGYTEFVTLNIEDIKWVAIDVLNSLMIKIKKDSDFEKLFLKNASHFLFDLQAFKLEAELTTIEGLVQNMQKNS